MNRIILFLSAILVIACGSAANKTTIPKGAFLVDVRTAEEYAEGSVLGSINIPLNELENRLFEFKDKTNIVVFCRSGSRAGTAKNILEKHGYKNIINGGSWQNVNEKIK